MVYMEFTTAVSLMRRHMVLSYSIGAKLKRLAALKQTRFYEIRNPKYTYIHDVLSVECNIKVEISFRNFQRCSISRFPMKQEWYRWFRQTILIRCLHIAWVVQTFLSKTEALFYRYVISVPFKNILIKSHGECQYIC